MLRLTEGSSRPWAAMASAGSTSRGITAELQVISHDDPVLEISISLSVLVCSSTNFIIEPRFWHLLSPPPQGLARPPNRR